MTQSACDQTSTVALAPSPQGTWTPSIGASDDDPGLSGIEKVGCDCGLDAGWTGSGFFFVLSLGWTWHCPLTHLPGCGWHSSGGSSPGSKKSTSMRRLVALRKSFFP